MHAISVSEKDHWRTCKQETLLIPRSNSTVMSILCRRAAASLVRTTITNAHSIIVQTGSRTAAPLARTLQVVRSNEVQRCAFATSAQRRAADSSPSPKTEGNSEDDKQRAEEERIRNLPLSPYGGRFGVPDQPRSTKSIALARANNKRSPFAKAKEGVKSKVNDWTDKEKNLEKRKEL